MENIELIPIKRQLDGVDTPYTLKNGIKYSIKTDKLYKTNEFNEVLAIDTETLKGYCRLICIHGIDNNGKKIDFKEVRGKGGNKEILSIPNTFYKPTFDTCIRFLTYHIREKGVYRFFFNIDFDIQAILKLSYPNDLNKQKEFIDSLSKGIPQKYVDNRGIEYEFRWIRSKLFAIKSLKSHRNVYWTDLYTFYNMGLGKAGMLYFNEGKIDYIDAESLNTDKQYWKDNQFDIVVYCMRDTELTAKLGKYLIDSILKVNLSLPKILVSPASLSKENYRKTHIPNLFKTPIQVVQMGYDCYYGGRFEVFKRGFFEHLYLYDVVSEYPYFLRELPDMVNGYWITIKGKIELPIEPPLLSFYKVKIDIPLDNKISTLPFKNNVGIVCFPNGKIEGWFTWYDLDILREYITDIMDCYIYIKNKRMITYPFRERTNQLFLQKQSINKKELPMDYNTVKITMNAIYGCTIETKTSVLVDDNNNPILDKDGKEQKLLKGGVLFNPIYASHITAFGRWKILKSIPKEKWDNIIAFHTDSVITDIDISEHLDIGKNLGQWDLEAEGKGIVINTGMYQIGKLVKTRGIPKKYIKNWLYFCLKYSNEVKHTFIIKHMKKVREAIIRDKNVLDMNTMVDIERSVNANSDVKRTWFNDFSNFKELIESNISSLPLVYKKVLDINKIGLSKRLGLSVETISSILNYTE